MDLVLVTGGTRGDTQPFVALGVGLRAAGYGVTIATHEDFREMVTSHGLRFRTMSGSMRAICESEQGREWIESGGSLTRYRKTVVKTFSPWWPRWFDDAHAASAESDAILFHPMFCGAAHTAEKRRVPSICVTPFPSLPTRLAAPAFFPAAPAWGWLRWWLSVKSLKVVGDVVVGYHQAHRRSLGLEPLESSLFWMDLAARGVPFLHIYSEVLEARPADWPENAHVTGSCDLPADPAWAPPRPLADFLAAGPPPIYVGFGSMTGRLPAELTALVVDAVTRAGLRAVVGTGWGGIDGQALPDHVHRVDDIPHDWLFERVSAVVHHGGVGTTTAGLRAGRPTLVVPFFGDQPYWGSRVAHLGAGPVPLPKSKLTAARLAEQMTHLLAEPRYAEGARRAQTAMLQEHGVARAVEVIGRYLA
jgi:sterol 3beta-glucosyltransferase